MKRLFLHFIFLMLMASTIVGQDAFFNRLADSAFVLTKQKVRYDPGYFQISYPNGDIPAHKGVCTDVVIRAYRKLGIDLQKEIHEDMETNFDKYPKLWGMKKTDKNIDHRRVPNLMTFFSRHGSVKGKSSDAQDYLPGDIVCWDLGKGIKHIGIVVNKKSLDGNRYLIVHNIGQGQIIEDCLFQFTIAGHYRYEKQ
ncbi:MAG: DUF1287 domain-containing protein [Prevotellaceae bacterium]|jgi:uncharacterized protein YijF (DUF1287 family)|nr:DUF1287 domain-containing protein [Prevotellaceae bacterium]